ncbi:MAG TPA: deoxyribonuclease IV [Candidatus Omnitrophica bacterium]|nr:deoxyribonuclease IV [Candidatus Omnitrophota bacterium]
MRLGVHVSIAGKIYEAVDRAQALGCETMQIFSRNPRGWTAAPLSRDDAKEFIKRRKKANIFPVLVHIPYIINLATPVDSLYKKSIDSYIEDIKRADALEAEYFITHLGSHTGSGEEAGLKRFCGALNIITEKANPKATILLETTAGSGSSLGYKFEHIQYMLKNIKQKSKFGVCIDSQHMFAAGYDITKKASLDKILKEFDKLIGLKNIKAVHLNDSKADLGSRVDRHEHIGKGKIGKEGIKIFINHPKLKGLPFVLETPKNALNDEAANLKTVRRLFFK